MKQRHPIRARLETGMTRLGFRVVPPLPRRMVVAMASLFAAIGWWFSPKLRRIGLANLDLAFGDRYTRAEKTAILRRSFRSFALVTLDAFWFSRDADARIARHVRFRPEFDVLFQSKGHVCITAHYGNWEVMGMAVAGRGYALHSVAKPLKNPTVDRLFIDARRANGQTIVKREGAVRQLLRILQQGGKIALVLDQNTRMREGGRFYPFFDRPVLVSTAVAGLALKTRTDLFVGMMAPTPDGDYVSAFGREIPVAPYLALPTDEAIDRITADVTRILEDFLRTSPDHWLWTYKRWKYIPEGDDPARYPFYARPVDPVR
jgi:lauroyl/myristoyl acyltransferase